MSFIFPQSRTVALRRDILCFQQNEKESIGAAWARFSLLLISGPNLLISDHVLLQHFYIGLDTESALYLDIAAGGSFSHKTPSEGREILDRITENTSFVANAGSSQEEHTSSHEDILAAESGLSPPTTQDSALEPSSEPQAPEEEEIQPSELPFEFEDDLFKDFGNTSNYLCTRKPLVPIPSIDPIEATFLRENIKKVTTIMAGEWSREMELSLEVLRISSPLSTIPCTIRGTSVDILYSPTVGANIISSECAFQLLGDEPLVQIDKTFQTSSRKILEGIGILQNMTVKHKNVDVTLDFHVFNV